MGDIMTAFKDLTGKKFGRLTVIGVYDKSKSGSIRWKCQCECGNIIPVFKNTLLKDNGSIKSCGCVYIDELRKEIGRKKDYLKIIDVKQYGRKGRVVVKCDCGTIREMTLSQFKNPSVHSCGCVGIVKGADSPYFKHGMSRTRIFNIYRGMLNRCYRTNDISYSYYGGRGIKICDEWLGDEGILNFAKWAESSGYTDELTIDRIDVNGNYCPENCRFVTNEVQAKNKRNSITEDERYRICPVCGKTYAISQRNGAKTCGYKCGAALRNITRKNIMGS